MFPVSATFKSEIVSGVQTSVIRAIVTLGADTLGELEILSGSVSIDGRRDGALRTLSLSIAPNTSAWQWLTAYGAEIKCWRGIAYADGTQELVPLGVFVIDADLERAADGSITVNGADRSQRISRARWTQPYNVAAGAEITTTIRDLLRDRWPAVPWFLDAVVSPPSYGTVAAALAYLPEASSDPWKDARELAASLSYDLYFDGNGVASLRVIPDPLTSPIDATYYTGELSIVLGETLKASLATVYNGVIATGEGAEIDPPTRGEAWDDLPSSPTYRYGPLGQVPTFYSSPLLTTSAAATAAAASILARVRGRVEQVAWSMIVNPAHDALDVIELEDTSTTPSSVRRFMLDQITIPLAVTEAMSATAREIRS